MALPGTLRQVRYRSRRCANGKPRLLQFNMGTYCCGFFIRTFAICRAREEWKCQIVCCHSYLQFRGGCRLECLPVARLLAKVPNHLPWNIYIALSWRVGEPALQLIHNKQDNMKCVNAAKTSLNKSRKYSQQHHSILVISVFTRITNAPFTRCVCVYHINSCHRCGYVTNTNTPLDTAAKCSACLLHRRLILHSTHFR